MDSSADLIRHVYFHCYHTKLKQWGLQALQSQANLSPCILDFQSRNIIPDIPDHFLCLWEHCEVSGQCWEWGGRKLGVLAHDALTLSGMPYVCQVPASISFPGSSLAQIGRGMPLPT